MTRVMKRKYVPRFPAKVSDRFLLVIMTAIALGGLSVLAHIGKTGRAVLTPERHLCSSHTDLLRSSSLKAACKNRPVGELFNASLIVWATRHVSPRRLRPPHPMQRLDGSTHIFKEGKRREKMRFRCTFYSLPVG